jgi:hypothetical protein
MTATTIVGIDPGLVDTGVVRLSFYPSLKRVAISYVVAPRFALESTPQAIAAWIRGEAPATTADEKPHIFIEKYNSRPGMAPNQRMTDIERALTNEMSSAVRVNNMGVRNVITQEMMELLNVWKFPTTTHHQDLRSAARIALFGAVKDEALNGLVATFVRDYTDWSIDMVKGASL